MDEKEGVSPYTIAAGILIAATVMVGIPRLVAAYQYRQAVSQFNEQIVASSNEVRRSAARLDYDRARRQQQVDARLRREAEAKALQPDERCLGGQRFRKIENGWEQIGSC